MWLKNALTYLAGLPDWIAAPVGMFLLAAIPACGFAWWQYNRSLALGFGVSIALSVVPLIVSAVLPASIVAGSPKAILGTVSLIGTAGFGGVVFTQTLRASRSRKQILLDICIFSVFLAWLTFLAVT